MDIQARKELTAAERDALRERIRSIKAHKRNRAEPPLAGRRQTGREHLEPVHETPGRPIPTCNGRGVPAIGLRQTEDGRSDCSPC